MTLALVLDLCIENYINVIRFRSVPFQSESESPPLRRAQPTTGGGGAPKLFLNWLTFALSPYDADHI